MHMKIMMALRRISTPVTPMEERGGEKHVVLQRHFVNDGGNDGGVGHGKNYGKAEPAAADLASKVTPQS